MNAPAQRETDVPDPDPEVFGTCGRCGLEGLVRVRRVTTLHGEWVMWQVVDVCRECDE